MIWMWAVGLVIVLIIWLTIDFYFGKKWFRKRVALRNYPIQTGDLEFITDGQDFFKRLFKDINDSTSSIDILFYIVKNDALSEHFLKLLEQKAKEGIQVRLLCDWVGSFGLKRKRIKQLKANGVQFAFSNRPKPPFFFFTFQQRNHRKITIIDKKIAYIGGFNIGGEYIGRKLRLSPWRDYHLRLTGPGVADLLKEFRMDWQAAGEKDTEPADSSVPNAGNGGIMHQFTFSDGVGLDEQLENELLKAKKSILIGSPYFIPTKRLLDALLKALKRGVHVSVIIPCKKDHPLVREAAYPFLQQILKAGANVYEFQAGFYHAKAIIIDHEKAIIGTTNFDQRSVSLNFECNCFIYNPSFIQNVIMKEIQEDIRQSKIMTYKEAKKMDPATYAKATLAKTLLPLL
ncbi:cardiolipin synthase [Bacillus smithii]|uniref:cardiolipin synthase n=1 Tax=Bacillus smithii TaxID=1479 RepID=UPI002E215DAD|nr:cardiolipin synthase [Bacillus smithii]MED1456504.1 cardiolipin synthase [Bacillus smithii]